jgi:glucose/arabinose dehydrogenase
VAALGVAFSAPTMGGQFGNGVFVGEHGSWNRNPPSGYKVVFVRFENGRPVGDPIDFVSGFRGEDGLTRGRPVGVTVDPRGALIVADDLSNTIWRVTPETPVAVPAATELPADTEAPAESAVEADVADPALAPAD